MSTSIGQVKGHIDNLASEFAWDVKEMAKYNVQFAPTLTVVTTADVSNIYGIKSYGYNKDVIVDHLVAYYRYGNKGVEFYFKEQ